MGHMRGQAMSLRNQEHWLGLTSPAAVKGHLCHDNSGAALCTYCATVRHTACVRRLVRLELASGKCLAY